MQLCSKLLFTLLIVIQVWNGKKEYYLHWKLLEAETALLLQLFIEVSVWGLSLFSECYHVREHLDLLQQFLLFLSI